ncbi:protein-L-isoaspartate(D-aspartate) O-methyltransferase [Lysobacter sp. A6]|uniref:Protein-L-isoaspartate O-methyltransferase n=1 Tax=Noviluteimonas lactosilytica TaxID=2888523 RepID=A0ABS8JF29_9GAMM|nr:protein-L-isoaspartate(D-aspartate) O-methyltransferase [Lysobacter lactosilyticus]MCC8362183.1 protein-L-isoaspartate(D-aspartate) O-methyltransferase [Lysobacter lactosilyticus]
MTARIHLHSGAVGVGMTSQRVRDRLIERLRANGINDERVLNAIRAVPRHLFVDEALATRAYEDTALPIGHGQTISQPWVVAKMTETLLETARPAGAPTMRVLEIGTGSGYQAAILAALGLEVFTVERIGELLRIARKRFRTLGFHIRSKHDDGRIGWPELAPFDAIIVTAAAPALVDALTAQLAPGGTLVCPVGASGGQTLIRLRKDESGAIDEAQLAPVVFVPLLPGMVD